MTDKIQTVDFKGADERMALLEKAKRDLANWPEIARYIAQQKKISFDCYIKEGFTQEQALELCKQPL